MPKELGKMKIVHLKKRIIARKILKKNKKMKVKKKKARMIVT